MIIIMRFGENNVHVQNISIYINFGRDEGDVHGPPYIFCSLLKKNTKV